MYFQATLRHFSDNIRLSGPFQCIRLTGAQSGWLVDALKIHSEPVNGGNSGEKPPPNRAPVLSPPMSLTFYHSPSRSILGCTFCIIQHVKFSTAVISDRQIGNVCEPESNGFFHSLRSLERYKLSNAAIANGLEAIHATCKFTCFRIHRRLLSVILLGS